MIKSSKPNASSGTFLSANENSGHISDMISFISEIYASFLKITVGIHYLKAEK